MSKRVAGEVERGEKRNWQYGPEVAILELHLSGWLPAGDGSPEKAGATDAKAM